MDAKLPDHGQCLTIQSSTSIYVYRSGSNRDTYNLFGNQWLLSATATNSTIPQTAICQSPTLTSTPSDSSIFVLFWIIFLSLFVLKILTEFFKLRGQR